ncbi:hypothetical protein [Mucilaginibacter terrenus]|uniref:hypothetical protein n=1 Tax=Mucilaginibacter terrenus TaxID=2482727 RepID=UPI00140218F7|nr:hypothetical protein [Mucilaginibacter terrenus]
MLGLIDKKQLVTLVLAGVLLFLLQKYLTKKVTKQNGEVAHYIGNDEIGVI